MNQEEKMKFRMFFNFNLIHRFRKFFFVLLFAGILFFDPFFLFQVRAQEQGFSTKSDFTAGDSHLTRAVRFFNCKEYDKAAHRFILAVNYDSALSDYARYMHARCMSLIYKKSKNVKDRTASIESYNRLIKFYPDTPFQYIANFDIALLYEQALDYKKAALHMDRAITEAQKRPEINDVYKIYSSEKAYEKLNDYYSRLKQWKKASQVYFNMVSSKWTGLNGYVLKQKIEILKKKYKDFAYIEKNFSNIMSLIYFKAGSYSDAVRVIELKPFQKDVSLLKILAKSYYALKNYKAALNHWQNIKKLKKGNNLIAAECSFNIAKCLKALKQYDQAKQICYDLALKSPKSYLADNALFMAGTIKKDTPDIELLKKIITAYPKGDVVLDAVNIVREHVFKKEGLVKEIKFLETLYNDSEAIRNNSDIAYFLADAYKKSGQTVKAEKIIQSMFKKDPDNFYGLVNYYGFNRIENLAHQNFSNKRTDFDHMNKLRPFELDKTYKGFNIAKKLRLNRACILFLHDILRQDPGNRDAAFNLSLYYFYEGNYRKSYALAASYWRKQGYSESHPDFIYLVYPLAYISHILDFSGAQLDPLLVLSIMREETHYLKDDISWTGAIGLMQIMPATGKWIAQKMENPGYRESRLFNPRVNIKFGCWYIKFLFQDLGRDIFDVVAAYNGGQGSVKKWRKAYKGLKKIDFIEKIPFSQTRRYVKKVMKSYLMYRKIYSEKVVF
jgi:soluble lytic murein transglycosylase